MANGNLLDIGTSGLLAFQRSLATTGHNIANVNTEGYSRQRVELSTRTPQAAAGDFIGSGVQTQATRRIYDSFLTTQLRSNTSADSRLQSFHALASQIDNLLADAQAGLSPSLQDFFNAVQGVANDPSSIPARQVLLSQTNALADRFHYLDQRFVELGGAINAQIQTGVAEINTLGAAIAKLNNDIALAQGGPGGEAPNDLLDQRDALLVKLAGYVAVTTVNQDDGAVNVFIGNGQTLVAGAQATALRVAANNFDATRLEVAYQVGATSTAISDALSGGTLGAALDFRRQLLDTAQNALGRIAVGVGSTFNAQHALGQDLTGQLGGNLFTLATPQVTGHTANTGTATISAAISSVSALTTGNYLLQRIDATNYTVTRLSDNVTVASFTSFPQTIDGVTLTLSAGTPAVGDSFLVRPTGNAAAGLAVAVSDPAKLAAAAPIRTSAALANTGSATISAGAVTSVANLPLPADVTLTYNSGTNQFTVAGAVPAVAPITYSAGATISFNGINFAISGTPVTGDVFTVSRNINGVSDNRNALQLAALQNQNTLVGGTATYQDTYGQLVADVGSQTHQAEVNSKAQSALLSQITQARDAVSGVNLDEEAADLVRFQQAYQAAAQVINISSTLFQTLLGALGR